MSNTEWVSGLRELADWLEQNPNLTLSAHIGEVKPFKTLRGATVPEARAFAERHSFDVLCEKPDGIDGVIREVGFSRTFGPMAVQIWGQDPYLGSGRKPKRPFARRLLEALARVEPS